MLVPDPSGVADRGSVGSQVSPKREDYVKGPETIKDSRRSQLYLKKPLKGTGKRDQKCHLRDWHNDSTVCRVLSLHTTDLDSILAPHIGHHQVCPARTDP